MSLFSTAPPTAETLSRLLLTVLILGLARLGLELLLLNQTDGVWQLIPIGLIGLASGPSGTLHHDRLVAA